MVLASSGKNIALANAGIEIDVRGCWDFAAVGLLQTAFTSAVAAVEKEICIVALIAVGISSILVPASSGKAIALASAAIKIEVRGCWNFAAVGLLQTAFTSAVAAVENEVDVLFIAVLISLYRVPASSGKEIALAFAGRLIEVRGFWSCAAYFLRKTAFTSAVAAIKNEVRVFFIADLISLFRFQAKRALALAFAGRLIEVGGFWSCAAYFLR